MYIIKCKYLGSGRSEMRELPVEITDKEALKIAADVQSEYDRVFIKTGNYEAYVSISLLRAETITGDNAYEARVGY